MKQINSIWYHTLRPSGLLSGGPMRIRHLQSRFVLAGGLLVAATIGSSVWSALTFVRLNSVVDETLRESQETIDLTADLASSLEREDDALLLFVSGDITKARIDLASGASGATRALNDSWRVSTTMRTRSGPSPAPSASRSIDIERRGTNCSFPALSRAHWSATTGRSTRCSARRWPGATSSARRTSAPCKTPASAPATKPRGARGS